MPLVSNYKSPAFPYGWIPVAVDIIAPNSISPPSGVRASVLPMRADKTDAAHLAIGPTHLLVNTGSTAPAWQQRAMIDSCGSLSDLCGGGDFRNWSETAVRNAVNAINPGNKAGVYITEEGEFGTINWAKVGINYNQGVGGGFSIDFWNQSSQKGWFDDQMRININAAGGWYGSGYDGHLSLFFAFHNDMNSIRIGLASNLGAYTLAQNSNAFGAGYYSLDRGANRGGVIKAYATGDDNRNRYVAGHLAHMMIDRMARTHKGWTQRVCFFFWPGFDERVGQPPYSGQIHRRVTPSGGTVTRSCPPLWSIPAQIFITAMAMLYDFDIFAWTEGERFGSNPAVSYPDAARGGDPAAEVTWSGDVGQYALASLVHTTGPVAYPHVPKGTYDIPIAAIHLSYFIRTHTTGLPAYAAVSVDGGAYPTMGTGYVIDQFLGQKVYAFKFTEGTKRTILVMDMNEPGSARNLTVDYGGGTHTFASRGGFLHASTHTV